MVAPDANLDGKQSPGAHGSLSPDEAIHEILSNTGLEVSIVDNAYVIHSSNSKENVRRESTEDIIVTGTRIRGKGPIGSPLQTVDRDTLDHSGRATFADYVQTIPQNFSGGPTEATVGTTARSNANTNLNFGSGINLRGLGSASTLTLFDGTRPALGGSWGAFTDLSLIPSTAIERVEILTDGASAIYGSDAVAGVVNIRFRNHFDGLETRLRAGTADGDYGEYQIAQLAGVHWNDGHLVLAGEYYSRGNLAAAKRDFVSEDLRPFGGPDLRSNFASPGTIIAADGRIFAIPAGQNGRDLSPADLIEGQINRGDAQRLIDILPSQKSLSLYGAVEQQVGSALTIFARALYADRRYQVHNRRFGPTPVNVTSANPFYVDPIGTGQPVTVFYDPSPDFGPEGGRGSAQALNINAGARAKIGTWTVGFSGGYGLQRERSQDANIVHFTRRDLALAATDPANALNVFGDGAVNDPALIDSLRGSYKSRNRYRVWTAALRADGDLLTLPAGQVQMAVGGEWRGDRLDFQSAYELIGTTRIVQKSPGLPGKRTVRSLYGEIVIPVFDSEKSLPGSLSLSVAGRYEDYSDVGDTANPKVGLRWEPTPGLSFRASYGRSFRAPFFNELVGTANATYQPVYLPDPQAPSGQTLVLALLGFRPGLGPEKATSWTTGFDLTPRRIPGLRLSATWFDIHYRDRIASASFDLFNFLKRRDIYAELVNENPDRNEIAAYFSNLDFNNPLGVAPDDIQAIVDGRTFNLSLVTIKGLDFDFGYERPLGDATVNLSLGGSRLFNIDQQVTRSAPVVNVVGMLGNPVKLRMRGRAGVTLDAFDASLSVNHVGSYRNATTSPAQKVKSWTTFDLYIGAGIMAGKDGRKLQLGLSVNNLFDKAPPYVLFQTANSVLGYDPEQASAIGRSMALQAIVTW